MAEETGLLLGVTRDEPPQVPGEIWHEFAKAKVHPDLGNIHFIARAITPPRRPRRFDTRFFTADATAIAAHASKAWSGQTPNWSNWSGSRSRTPPSSTCRQSPAWCSRNWPRASPPGIKHSLPVPFYFMENQKFCRELL